MFQGGGKYVFLQPGMSVFVGSYRPIAVVHQLCFLGFNELRRSNFMKLVIFIFFVFFFLKNSKENGVEV